jgi:hypothetical protein
MFIAALFTIVKFWKQPRCPTTNEQIKKMWYLYTMVFIQRGMKFCHAGKWTELESNILSEVSQVQKVKSHIFSLICGV